MWILPRNYPLYSRYALVMVESKEDLTSQGLNIESSLMWRSKPSQLRTWLTRWSKVSWFQHLSGRILKPSMDVDFEDQLTSLLGAIPASPSLAQVNEMVQKIAATCSHSSKGSSRMFFPEESSLKMLRDISLWDLEKSSTAWNAEVTKRRGEYSARLKRALPTKGSESTSWATPNTMDYLPQRSPEALKRQATTTRKGRTRPANLREQVNPIAVAIYEENLPTPRASEYKDCGPVGSKSQIHMDKRSYLCARVKDPDMPTGKLNPTWVEWLMGVPTGWTELDF